MSKTVYIVISQTGTALSRILKVVTGAKIRYKQANSYYCSEFVKEMLIRGGIREARELADIVEPIHFLTLPNANHVYSGKLKDFANKT